MVPTAVVLAALVAGLLRAGYHFATRELRRVAGIRRRAIVIGGPEDVSRVEAALGSTASGIAYEFLETPAAGSSGRMPRTVRDARSAIADQGVNEIIVADPEVDERDLLAVVDAAHRRGVKVRLAPRATEILAERGRYVPGQAIPLFEVRPPALAGTDWVLKRSFDLTTSILLLVVGLPLWLLIALAVKTSRGPVLYRDRRVGLNEREFFMFKFRTMHATAPERQAELETANQTDGALFKLRDDPRRTRVGAILRRFSLDEIPQILNVLRGEMSLVGPRPLPLRDNARLEPWHRQRYRVLPGMTGLWQISGRSNLGFNDLVRLDFYYLENWSIWLDITILLRTVPAVLARRGAY
jgi:exopolysaccharide biosynthesis polyprenyl glycosylphosphotransferase